VGRASLRDEEQPQAGGAPRALGVEEVLPIARQIAEALEAAHEHGIIHPDLKPAHIKARPDGTVKVLDFGLAKALDLAPPSDLSQSPTIATPAATRMGVIMGTPAYMSPEQAKGRPVDKRADIWAFGCVLYEMLTGTRAFAGDDVSDTLAFIITKEPDWSALPATAPPLGAANSGRAKPALAAVVGTSSGFVGHPSRPASTQHQVVREDSCRQSTVTFARHLRARDGLVPTPEGSGPTHPTIRQTAAATSPPFPGCS